MCVSQPRAALPPSSETAGIVLEALMVAVTAPNRGGSSCSDFSREVPLCGQPAQCDQAAVGGSSANLNSFPTPSANRNHLLYLSYFALIWRRIHQMCSLDYGWIVGQKRNGIFVSDLKKKNYSLGCMLRGLIHTASTNRAELWQGLEIPFWRDDLWPCCCVIGLSTWKKKYPSAFIYYAWKKGPRCSPCSCLDSSWCVTPKHMGKAGCMLGSLLPS